MTSYTIEKLPGEPILLSTTHESWRADVDVPTWVDDSYQALESQTQPVFYITDVLQAPPWTLPELVRTTDTVARGQDSVFHHPNIREVLMVTRQYLVKLAAKDMRAESYGRVPIRTFHSREEALAYARLQ